MAHDVFISYSTKDKTIADAVCAKLEENKIRVWIAPRDVPAGANFGESIIRAINTCKVFVLIWSANTNTSNHILNEINQAFDQGITIIPFRIQDIQPTDEMRYYFGRTHWLDAINPPLENHITKLKDTILVNLGREPQPSTPTPPLDESPKETIKLADEPSAEKEPAIERAEAVKLPMTSPDQKIDKEIHRSAALLANITRFIPFAAGGLAVITLVILLISGVFKGSPNVAIVEDSPSPSATITPISTVRPTNTNEPSAPTPTLSAIQIALDAINNEAPYYQTSFGPVDFGDLDSSWARIEAGKLIVTSVMEHVSVEIHNFSSDRFAVEFEVRILEAAPGHCGLEILDDGVGESWRTLSATFTSSGQAELGYHTPPDKSLVLASVTGTFDFSKSNIITLLILGDQIAAFFNGQLGYTALNPDGSYVFTKPYLMASHSIACEYDNYKFWNLDKIED